MDREISAMRRQKGWFHRELGKGIAVCIVLWVGMADVKKKKSWFKGESGYMRMKGEEGK